MKSEKITKKKKEGSGITQIDLVEVQMNLVRNAAENQTVLVDLEKLLYLDSETWCFQSRVYEPNQEI